MAVHHRPAIVVVRVDGGDVVSAGLVELGQIPLQHLQLAQGEGLHAIELGVVGQQAVGIAFRQGHDAVQHLLVCVRTSHLTEIVLGHKLLHYRGAAIDLAAVGDAPLGLHLVNDLLGQGHGFMKEVSAGLEVARVGQDKIRTDASGHEFIQIKPPDKGGRNHGEHHRQGQGEDRHHRLPFAAAQVGPGHGEGGDHPPRFLLLLFQVPPFGITYRLNGRDLGGHPPRPGAGEQDGEEGEQRRPHEDQRIDRNHLGHAIQVADDHRRQLSSDEPPQHQTDGDAHAAEQQGLLPQEGLDLPSGGADGL